MLYRVLDALKTHRQFKARETERLSVYVQSGEIPEFLFPSKSWQDARTSEEPDKHIDLVHRFPVIHFPLVRDSCLTVG